MPLYCPRCTASTHGKAISELCETVQALAVKVKELKASHSSEASLPTCHCTHNSEPSWVEAVWRKHSHRSGEGDEGSNKDRVGSNRNGKQNSKSKKGGREH